MKKKKRKNVRNDQMNSTSAVTKSIWIKIHEIILYNSPFGQLFLNTYIKKTQIIHNIKFII